MNLINLMKLYRNDLFEDIRLPEDIDHDTCVNTILQTCALNEPIYPEHELFKMMISNFFNRYYDNFDKYNKALKTEYTPDENYIKYDDKNTDDVQKNHTLLDGHQVNTLDDHEVREDYKMAFDANDWRRTDRKDDKFYNMDDYKQYDNTDENKNRNIKTTNKSHGLTGIYSHQRLIDEEIKLRTNYNIYSYIANLFYAEFMIKCV